MIAGAAYHGEVRTRLLVIALAFAALPGCRQIFGIDPPQLRDGGGSNVDRDAAGDGPPADAQQCFGSGPFTVCLATLPIAPATLPATLDTGTSVECANSQPPGWAPAQPAACFVIGTDVTIGGSGTIAVTGSRPLVVIATGTLTIAGTLDAATRNVTNPKTGPASAAGPCNPFTQVPGGNVPGAAGGGAGGSFVDEGGHGGSSGANAGGAPGVALAAPTTLRGGCAGQPGSKPTFNDTVDPGPGGGAVYLVAGTAIAFEPTGLIDVSGAAGVTGGVGTGGSGGGSGGMLVLYAPVIGATGGALMANGGGGTSAGDSADPGMSGHDPSESAPTTPALGALYLVDGGNGAAATTAATSATASPGVSGGGGGGGIGYIRANVAVPGLTSSPPISVVTP